MKTSAFQQKGYYRTTPGTRLFSEDTSRRPPNSSTGMYQTTYRQDGYQNGYWVSLQEP